MSNEAEMTLFEPEGVLPAQMCWGGRCDGDTSGARALMLAILADAMLCVERGRRRRHPRTRQLALEAEAWMRSDCRGWLFSFASIADVLGIDADALRVRFLRTNVAHAANGGRTAHGEADGPSTRGRDVARLLPQRARTPAAIAAATAREPSGRCLNDGARRSGFNAPARLEVA